MAFFPEYPAYRDDFEISSVEKPQEMTVRLLQPTPSSPNVLVTYTGTLVSRGFKGKAEEAWRRGGFRHRVTTSRKWTQDSGLGARWTLFLGGTAMIALASIFNDEASNDAGWAVDAGWVSIFHAPPPTTGNDTPSEDYLQLNGLVAVRDTDGYIFRISYQVTALGRQIFDDVVADNDFDVALS